MNKETFVKEREYEWLVISQSYFQCALMNARILREKLSNFAITVDSPLDFCLKKIYGNYPQDCDYLIFPIIFNFKHGIEIYLKAIAGMRSSEFVKNHNLIELLDNAAVKDGERIGIIKKYAFSHLLLPRNENCDTKNEFERYPQGSPYDDLWLFPAVNNNGQIENAPENMGFDDYIKWMQENNLEIKSLITQEKIDELIKDIEFLMLGLRKVSFSASQK